MANQGFRSSCINASSPFAEREISLSEIDSQVVNGEITKGEAKDKIIQWAVDTGNAAMLPGILATLMVE